MTTFDIVLGSADEAKRKIKCNPKKRWISNVPQPNFAMIKLPNGEYWDLYTFHPLANPSNPFPIDEEIEALIIYTGFTPPGFVIDSRFKIIIQQEKF